MIQTDLRREEASPQVPSVLESRNPATGAVLGRVEITPADEVERVAAEVAVAQRAWAGRPLRDRENVVRQAAQVMLRRSEELAIAVTSETGKTLMESTAVDVGAGAMVFDWIGRYAHRYIATERVPTPQLILKHKRHTIVYRPLGVVGVISAWNYPLLVPAGPVGMALVAGNGVVLKPSEYTPLVGDLLATIFAEAGLPDGVLRVVHGAAETGAAMCAAPSIAKICFTGGVENGSKVSRLAAEHGKPVILELGGNDPAIVCHDSDLGRAVAGTLWAGAAGAGQTCAAVERVYVDRRVYREYVDRLTQAARTIRLGHPMDPGTDLGPLISESQFARVMADVDQAVSKGARVECGGPVEVGGLSGRFIAPMVLTGADQTMSVMRNETFGPVIPVVAFETEEEAIRLANDSSYGLGASIWTRSMRRGRRIARRLDAGMVWINDHGSSVGAAQVPWAGVKNSGHGIIHSKFGLYEMVEKRLVSEDRGLLPVAWWFPYDEAGRLGFIALLQTVYADGLRGKFRAGWDRRSTLLRFVRRLVRSTRTRPE
jgi:succinate-semialdehyde dehydrogenase/glutarate-semialdehyde dehydrogenase